MYIGRSDLFAVGQVADFVLRDHRRVGISHEHAQTTHVLHRAILDQVVEDLVVAHRGPLIAGMMVAPFDTAHLNRRAGDVAKNTTRHHIVAAAIFQIETGTTQMCKRAPFEADMPGRAANDIGWAFQVFVMHVVDPAQAFHKIRRVLYEIRLHISQPQDVRRRASMNWG